MTPFLLKTKYLRAIVCCVMLLFSVSIYATDYYVDASGGSDSNSGTSPASAWKTVAKVSATKFNAGDRILFKKGETWRETLNVSSSGSAGNPIIYSSYGSGANPLISASDLIVSGWSADGGNRWKATVTTQPNILYINGTLGIRASSASGVSSANTWYWGSNTLYVYSPANGDPSKYYTAPGIEAGSRQIAIDCNDKTDITIDGFTLRDGNATNFNAGIVRVGTTTSLNVTIKNCLIERGRSVGVEAGGSSKASNLLIDNCTIQNNGSFAVLYNNDQDNARLLNSQILSNGWASKEDNQQTSNIQGNLCGVEIAFCNIYNGAPGVAYANDQCHGIYVSSPGTGFAYIHDNTISGNTNGAAIKVRQNCYIINNVIYNNRLEGVELGGNGPTDAVYYVVKNRIYASTAGFPAISEFAKGTGRISLNVFNNTTYKNGVIGAECSIQDNLDTLRILNNIFYAANGRYGVTIPNITGVKVIDYNLYWRDDGGGAPNNKYSTSSTTTLSSWQSMGFDVHGLNVNPKLMSPTSNFALNTGSPAIDKGSNSVSLPYSGLGPDMGAIESGGVGNVPPTANAGNDTSITLPANLVKLQGTGKDVDGTIASYAWTKVSGPASGTLVTPGASNTDASGLVAGTYVFRLTVTDNLGATGSDDIQVTVVAAPLPNQKPTANAGSDVSITLPTNTTKLNGSGTDPDGTIASYSWTMVSGPAGGSIQSPTAASTDVNSLVAGTYVLRLTVTDDKGATSTDDVQITVTAAAPPPNQAPTTNAGTDVTITLPTSTTSFTASSSDPDGTISTYAWSQVSGPNTATIQAPAASTTNISGLVAGVYVFRMTVTDNGGATATDDIQVTVKTATAPPPNQAPTTNAGTDVTITLPTSTTSFTATSSDPDGTISTYAWTQVSGPNTASIQAPAASTTNISGLVAGVYVFRMTVTDNGGATATDDIQVTVNTAAPPPNQAPTTNAGTDVTITLPTSTTSFTASSSDPDGTISTYAWSQVSGPNTASIQAPAASATNISGLIAGVYVFRMTVTDNGGATATDDIQVTVNAATAPPANQAPTANAGSDISITLPTSTTSFAASASDPDGTISTYAWTQVSGPNTATIQKPAASATNISGLIAGTYVFRITVKDNGGAIAADDIQVTVTAAPVNQLPIVNAGSDISVTLPVNATSFSATGLDPDGTISQYAWKQITGPNTATIATPGSSATNISGLVAGLYTFRVTVTDNGGATANDDITVIVNAAPPPPNTLPVADAGTDVTITLPTNSVTVTGTGTDTDGTIAQYKWSKVSGPAGGTIQTSGAAATNITALNAGTYVYRLTVTDNSGGTATDNVQITVNSVPVAPANQPPSANAGANTTVTLPAGLTLNGSGADVDGTVASFGWTKVSGPAATIQNPSSSSTNVTGIVAGTYVFRLTVTDDKGASTTDDVQIIVLDAPVVVNQLPSANAGVNLVITLPTNSVSLNGTGSDPDGSIANYAWTKVSGPTGDVIQSSNASATNVDNLTAGVYVYRLTVTDDKGATATDDVQITVNSAPPPPANQPPTANAGANITITLPAGLTLNGSATDADGTVASYSWSQVSGPAASIENANSSSTNVNGIVAGTYVFRLTVTDDKGATDADDVQVIVLDAPVVPVANQLPSANAGVNLVIKLPTNSVSLSGAGSDPDGTIAGYAWTKVSGPTGDAIQSPNASATNVDNLIAGVYVYRLTVTDDQGATATDDVQITVKNGPAPPANQPPTANAGANITITLPAGLTLNGSATDADGTVASYSWSQVSGPAASIQDANSSSTNVTGIVAGTYVFRLTVTDDKGATDADDVQVLVIDAPIIANQLPLANAGVNLVITLPTNSVFLSGAGTDADGTITNYAWTKLSGPAGGIIQSPNASATGVDNFTAGTYVYRLTVTDDKGATATDDIQIQVNNAPLSPTTPNLVPIAEAGNDQSLVLPNNSVILDGSQSSDPDGSIANYFWTRVQGPGAVTFDNGNTVSPTISGLQKGTYVFELTVTDNDGATATDLVTVTVGKVNQKPKAVVADTVAITLPVQNTLLDASASTDPDGSIVAYNWTYVDGPTSPTVLSPDSSKTVVSDLKVGNYEFLVSVTDDDGDVNQHSVVVVVNPGKTRLAIPKVTMYPNPAQNFTNITMDISEGGRAQIIFYDVHGRPVKVEKFVKPQGTYVYQVNLSDIARGTYIVSIQLEHSANVVKKLIKF